ncbi:hypothetical protein [Bradyrhizobium sp. Tv2a-2]|uniref:hypothetical protein n=1 Tax=Bradyrhizobium sp. Tv2a-2 TaxID=113395 RepID=UPI000423B954|nr:hypothetical protein [Bradyrhizobium sp. Tv2a-2]
MRHLLGGLLGAGCLILAIDALAQSAIPSANPPSTNTPSVPVVQNVTAPAAPVNPSRRFVCRAAAQKFQGQERADQMQLCVEQVRLDCLRQAIDQKVVGPQRRDFVQDCIGE